MEKVLEIKEAMESFEMITIVNLCVYIHTFLNKIVFYRHRINVF